MESAKTISKSDIFGFYKRTLFDKVLSAPKLFYPKQTKIEDFNPTKHKFTNMYDFNQKYSSGAPGVVALNKRMSKRRCRSCPGRDGCLHVRIYDEKKNPPEKKEEDAGQSGSHTWLYLPCCY